MKIAITGAAGFVGCHLSKRLEDEGYDLLLIDDFSRGKQEYLDYIGVKTKCIKADLTFPAKAYSLFDNVDTVYHTACRIGGMQFLHDSSMKELKVFQYNTQLDNEVFSACINKNVKKIIYTSSISVYNTEKQYKSKYALFNEIDTETNISPEGGYGWSKFIAEKQLDMMSDCGMKVGVSRIFKSYGACDDYSIKSGQVVLSLMRKVINHPEPPFSVWGDGSVTRNLVYVDDLIDCILKLSDYVEKESLTVNVGGDRPISIRELAEKTVILSGKNIDIEYDTTMPAGPISRVPDLRRAEEKLGWKPTTSLDDGLEKCWQWMKNQKIGG